MTEHTVLPSVLFREVDTADGHRLGFAQLNAEKALNALSLDMVRLLDEKLRAWAKDDGIVCVVLYGAGDKAFCAGGDIRAMYRTMLDHPGSATNPAALAFFCEEYRLDWRIHIYPKPILVWGSGIVMGGGLGLLAGASHRVVTETSRIAMPEVSIGLFPDVGGSWFLPRMPGRMGLFVALTGVALNAPDALFVGLGDHWVSTAMRVAVFERMSAASWQASAEANRSLLTRLLNKFSAAESAALASNLERRREIIDSLCAGDDLAKIVSRIAKYAGEDAWLKRGACTLEAGSPTTVALAWELRQRAAEMSLADVFRLELIVALQCCAHPDFAEGVRALLIDKDNAPRWTPRTLAEVSPEWLAGYFQVPAWPQGVHPLADL